MKKQALQLATAIVLYGSLAGIATPSHALPDSPALDLVIGNNKSYFSVVAERVQISDELAYSTSYSSRRGKFVAPEFYYFTLHGYHNNAEWKGVTFVDFKIGNQQFSGKPVYRFVGPERIRTLGSHDANYIESLTLKLPANIARQIAYSKANIPIMLGFSNQHLLVPASKLGRFKQLINSAAAYTKQEKAKPISKGVAPGLPIKQVPHKHLALLETADTDITETYSIQAIAATAYHGQKLSEPKIAFFVVAVNEEPLLANVTAVTFSYGGKKLHLSAKGRDAEENNGVSVESLTSHIPYRDFIAMTKAAKFYVTVGSTSFEVNRHQATGLRELARRISKS